jgi:hypothetical protein
LEAERASSIDQRGAREGDEGGREKREETVKLVKGAEKLGRNLRNLNIVRLVGSSAGFAGAFVSGLGIALVLFTVRTRNSYTGWYI